MQTKKDAQIYAPEENNKDYEPEYHYGNSIESSTKYSFIKEFDALAEFKKIGQNTTLQKASDVLQYEFFIPDNLRNITIIRETIIGYGAFYNMHNVKVINLPTDERNTLTQIAMYAFYYDYNLTNMFVPNSVTNISISSFAGCVRLQSMTLPLLVPLEAVLYLQLLYLDIYLVKIHICQILM